MTEESKDKSDIEPKLKIKRLLKKKWIRILGMAGFLIVIWAVAVLLK